jgi:hypothetical protein
MKTDIELRDEYIRHCYVRVGRRLWSDIRPSMNQQVECHVEYPVITIVWDRFHQSVYYRIKDERRRYFDDEH